MPEYIPTIVLGTHKLGLGVIRALGKKGIPIIGIYYNDKDMGYVSKYVIRKYKCNNPGEDENGLIELLLELSHKWNDSVIIPTDDQTLLAASKNKEKLEKYFKVACCKWDIVKKFIFKKYTYEIADRIGVPSPQTLVPTTIEEAVQFADYIGYPCLLKPTLGHQFFALFRNKMIIVESRKSLKENYLKAENKKVEMMVQELIPGDDTHGVNYNSYFHNGSPVVEFTAQKLRLSPAKIGFPRVIFSKYIPDLYEPGRKMLRSTQYYGFSCMEFKRDARNGIYKLMEINARQNLSSMLAVKCGINFPYITYLAETQNSIPNFVKDYRKNVFWIDIEKDFIETLKNCKSAVRNPVNYFKPYFKKKVFCILSVRDPKPFIKRITDAVSIAFSCALRLFKGKKSNKE